MSPSKTYYNVVSRDTVHIGFLIAALYDIGIPVGDIQNAFLLEAPMKEKIFSYAGDKWKTNKDWVVVAARAFYGLKSLTLQFKNHLADISGNKLGFKSSLVDPDLWHKASIDSTCCKYYVCVLVYVNDLSIINKMPKKYSWDYQSDIKQFWILIEKDEW